MVRTEKDFLTSGYSFFLSPPPPPPKKNALTMCRGGMNKEIKNIHPYFIIIVMPHCSGVGTR